MVQVSVIIPIHNGEKWIDSCLQSVLNQRLSCAIEVSIFDDSSTDNTQEKLKPWQQAFRNRNIGFIVAQGQDGPKGVGYAKNRAVEKCSGEFLCFQDVDDVMFETRIEEQHKSAETTPNCIIGAKFVREPPNSTSRFTRWANNLPHDKLSTQIYTSHGPTAIMPTWFCSRKVFERVCGFSEKGHGTPEDLIFFYRHLDLGGGIVRVDKELLTYTYHPSATTFSIHEDTIFTVRMKHLLDNVICKWKSFVIWNAGRQGRKLYRALPRECRDKVSSFCDVDVKKIERGIYTYEESDEVPKPRVPIKHFRDVRPPFVICMKLDLTDGAFEANLALLDLVEGSDYVLFT